MKFKTLAIVYVACLLIVGLASEYITLFQPTVIPNWMLNVFMVLELISYVILVWIIIKGAKLFDKLEVKNE